MQGVAAPTPEVRAAILERPVQPIPTAPPPPSAAVAPRAPPPASPATPTEPLQCSRCSKWLQPGAKYRNKRLKLCSSCYVNHHNHASQDAKKKYDRSRKRSLTERRAPDGSSRQSSSADSYDDESTMEQTATPVTRLFPAPFPPAQPPQFSVPLQPRSFRPPVSPGPSMLGTGEVNQLGNPRSPSLLPLFPNDIPLRPGRIGSAPGTPTAIPLMEINQLSQGRIGSPGQPGTPTMSGLFSLPVNPLTVSLSPLLPSAILAEPQLSRDIDLQVGGMAGRVLSFEQQTEGVINAVASLIAQDSEPTDDHSRLQYLETDIRKLYALEAEWKRWSSQYNNTIVSAKKLLEQLQQAQGSESPLFAYCASRLGAMEYRAGNFNNAAKLFITAIIHNEKVHRKMEVLADTQKLGITYGSAGFLDEERAFHELAIRLGKALLPSGLQPRESPPSHTMLLERSVVFHHNCSIYYFRTKAYGLAEECNQEALRLLRILPQAPQRNTQRAAALYERALILAQKNEYSAAQAELQQSFQLSLEAYGENHPRIAEVTTSQGILHYLTDKLELAQSYLYKALKLKMQYHQRESHPSILASLQALGLISLRDPTACVFNPMHIFEHRPVLADIADQARDE